MNANLYLKFENLTNEERKEIDIAINIMEKIKKEYDKCYGRSDVLGFDDAIKSLINVKDGDLF